MRGIDPAELPSAGIFRADRQLIDKGDAPNQIRLRCGRLDRTGNYCCRGRLRVLLQSRDPASAIVLAGWNVSRGRVSMAPHAREQIARRRKPGARPTPIPHLAVTRRFNKRRPRPGDPLIRAAPLPLLVQCPEPRCGIWNRVKMDLVPVVRLGQRWGPVDD
jgi:hypothetical protein